MAKARQYTQEELEFIKTEYLNNTPIKEIAKSVGVGTWSIINLTKNMGIFTYKTRRWTKDEINYLKENYNKTEWDIILTRLCNWNKNDIIKKASSLNLKRSIYFWNDTDIELLKNAYQNKIPTKEIVILLNNKFTEDAILTKAHKLGIYQKEVWSDDENEKFKLLYPKLDMEQILIEFPNRSRNAIIAHAESLNLSYKTTWTKEETEFLIENHRKMTDEEIGKVLNRTKDSVRGKRWLEKLYHPVEPAVYNTISEYIRKRNREWKRQSAKKCNYKCMITGNRSDAIHHLYGMNLIVKETLDDLNYDENCRIEEMTEQELNIILEHFLEIQNKYPLGVCLCTKIHKQFHDEYGYGNNTPFQFKEFLSKHQYRMIA